MPPEPERFPLYTISYGQFLGALTVLTLVVVIGYLVLVVAGQRELAEMRDKLAEVRTAENAGQSHTNPTQGGRKVVCQRRAGVRHLTLCLRSRSGMR